MFVRRLHQFSVRWISAPACIPSTPKGGGQVPTNDTDRREHRREIARGNHTEPRRGDPKSTHPATAERRKLDLNILLRQRHRAVHTAPNGGSASEMMRGGGQNGHPDGGEVRTGGRHGVVGARALLTSAPILC
jgi:hypothetical protein